MASLLVPRVTLLSCLLAACVPEVSLTSGPETGSDSGDPDSDSDGGDNDGTDGLPGGEETTSVGEETTSVGDEDTGGDEETGGDEPDGDASELMCEGARWVRVPGHGSFTDLAVDAQSRVFAFGDMRLHPAPRDALAAEFAAISGDLVLETMHASAADEWVAEGGVDPAGNIYAVTREAGGQETWLHKHAPAGALLWSLDLAAATELDIGARELAISPGGDAVLSGSANGSTVIVRVRSDGALEWVRWSEEHRHVHGINANGMMVATRWYEGVSVLDGDGDVVWDADWPLFKRGAADINDRGEVVIGGENPDPGEALRIARFDRSGAMIHSRDLTVLNAHDTIADLEVNEAGEVGISGYLQVGAPAGLNAFALKLDATDATVATYTCWGDVDSRGYAVAFNEAGEVFIAGDAFIDAGATSRFVVAFE